MSARCLLSDECDVLRLLSIVDDSGHVRIHLRCNAYMCARLKVSHSIHSDPVLSLASYSAG